MLYKPLTMTQNSRSQSHLGNAPATTSTLAPIIDRWTSGNQEWRPPITDLLLFRRDRPAPPTICLIEPSIVLVAQGAKRMFIGGESHVADRSRFVITSINIPGQSEVLQASPTEPCLGIAMRIDIRTMAELITKGVRPPNNTEGRERSMVDGKVTMHLVEPFKRLLDLLDEPETIPIMAPLILSEIHFRLLMSDQAHQLWQAALVGSQSHRIIKSVDWLKLNYHAPLSIDELAARAQMSVSAFRQHFRRLTAMSPLQYQKWLRLNEARRLMLSDDLDAASAAFRVGYESPSQFSREYNRLFGASPRRDVRQLRSIL